MANVAEELIANRYALIQKIGIGGMGDVYRGIDQQQQTPIAIKVLKPELASPEMIARFVREGETLRQLNHPHIVAVRDAVQEKGQYYLIMELVEGGSLGDWLDKTPRPPLKRVLEIALDLADGLARAHRLEIVHRDIKPANVLLAKDGSPRLTDFGIARVTNSKITETGIVIGTTAYIAPEVLQGQLADSRSDIWSFGVMLYEMLTGQRPFQADNPGNLIYEIIAKPLPDLEIKYPDLPASLIDLLYRMLMKNPAERIPSMRLVGAELEAALRGERFAPTPIRTTATVPLPDADELTARFATPSPVASSTRHNLPVQTAPFVGREAELLELQKLLNDSAVRLITILAPGGMGKTRLSLEAAAHSLKSTTQTQRTRFTQGIYFVDLAPLTSAENIIPTIAETIGYLFQKDGRDPRQQILDYLREKNILFIMDNFENVTEGRTIVSDMIAAAPGVKILVTSREKLNLSSETVFAISGMEFPTWETPEDALDYSAVKLFMQGARRVRPEFELQAGDLSYIARICKSVYGMPLGILLAAAWLELLSPREIAEEISQNLDFLETEMHDVPERHRSLRNVFEYSWGMLVDAERHLFARLAIFRGGFTREAAQAITGANLRTLGTLVNKSLLRRDVVSGRYEVHELLRQYALEKLEQSGDIQAIQTVHMDYYMRFLEQLAPKIMGHGQLDALTAIENDFENIRAAWTWALEKRAVEAVSRAMDGLYRFLNFRNRQQEGQQLFRLGRQVWSAEGDNAPLIAGQMLVRYPDEPVLANFRRGLAIAQQHTDLSEIAFCERLLGHWLSHNEYNQGEGIPLLLASIEHYEALDHQFCLAQVLDDIGWSYNLNMQAQAQRKAVERSLEIRRQIGDKIGMANSLRNMGGASGGFFDPSGQAFTYWEEAKQVAYSMNDRTGIAWNALLQALVRIFVGEWDAAAALLEEGDTHAREVSDPLLIGLSLIMEGMLTALVNEDYVTAERLIMEGYPPGSPPDFRAMLATMGVLITACGSRNYEQVKSYVEMFNQINNRMSIVFLPMALPLAAMKYADAGEPARAAEFLGYFYSSPVMGDPNIDRFRLQTGWAARWKLMQDFQARLENILGASTYQAAWERGKTLQMADITTELIQYLS